MRSTSRVRLVQELLWYGLVPFIGLSTLFLILAYNRHPTGFPPTWPLAVYMGFALSCLSLIARQISLRWPRAPFWSSRL